jgi:hypothetical protein
VIYHTRAESAIYDDEWAASQFDYFDGRWHERNARCKHLYDECDDDTLPECIYCGHPKDIYEEDLTRKI